MHANKNDNDDLLSPAFVPANTATSAFYSTSDVATRALIDACKAQFVPVKRVRNHFVEYDIADEAFIAFTCCDTKPAARPRRPCMCANARAVPL